jgi:hypothetical protein
MLEELLFVELLPERMSWNSNRFLETESRCPKKLYFSVLAGDKQSYLSLDASQPISFKVVRSVSG